MSRLEHQNLSRINKMKNKVHKEGMMRITEEPL